MHLVEASGDHRQRPEDLFDEREALFIEE